MLLRMQRAWIFCVTSGWGEFGTDTNRNATIRPRFSSLPWTKPVQSPVQSLYKAQDIFRLRADNSQFTNASFLTKAQSRITNRFTHYLPDIRTQIFISNWRAQYWQPWSNILRDAVVTKDWKASRKYLILLSSDHESWQLVRTKYLITISNPTVRQKHLQLWYQIYYIF